MNLLSSFWQRIQHSLFPELEEVLGPLTTSLQRLVAILELIRIEDFIRVFRGLPGRPLEDRRAIARSFVAKMVLNLPTTRALLDRLHNDTSLRRICGWERRGQISSESSFSRAFSEFATTDLPAKVHAALIEKHEKPRLVGHISRDSSAIEAREKPRRDKTKKEKEKQEAPRRRKGRPRKGEEAPSPEPTRLQRQLAGMSFEEMLTDLPTSCDIGCKKNSKGYIETWIGYKLHADWADGEIPISCLLSSASLHDSQAAIPLAVQSAGRVSSLYDLMDSAYAAPQIKIHSRSLGHVPIIDQNPRRREKLELEPAAKVRYNERTTAERGFSQIKDNYGGSMVRVRGHVKVFTHLMFGILALTAEQLLRLVT